MANTLTVNPYIVNTVMGASMKNSGGLPNAGMPIYVTQIYWENPVNIGDTFVFNDQGGTTRLLGRCEVANQSQVFPFVPPIAISDFTVPTIASGTLYISTF